MRIQTIRTSNYMTLRAQVIEVPKDANAVLIAGPNGAGKSALIDAIRLLLTGVLPRELGYKKELPSLITEGEKDGWVGATIASDGHTTEYKVGLKSGVASVPPPLAAHAALSVMPQSFMRLEAKERRSALYALHGVSMKGSDIVADLVKEGHAEDRVKRVASSLSLGFPKTAARAKELASEARGAWQATTGETYGSQKAADWKAPIPEVEDLGDPRGIEAQLAGKRDEAVAASRRLVEVRNDERAHAGATDARAKAAKLEQAEVALSEHDAKIEQAQRDHAVNKQAAASGGGWTCPCPSCKTVLRSERVGELTVYDPGAAAGPRAAVIAQAASIKLEELRGARPKLAKAADDARAAKLYLERLPPRPDAKELEEAEQAARELTEEVGMLENQLVAAKAAQTAELDAANATAAALRYHEDMQAYTALAAAVDALPARYLADTLSKVNDALDTVSKAFGERVVLGEDMELRYGMVPYGRLSESQKWRADLALGLALAPQSSGVVLMDRFDMVQQSDRAAILGMLRAQTRAQVFIAATLKEAPSFPAGSGLFAYWLGS